VKDGCGRGRGVARESKAAFYCAESVTEMQQRGIDWRKGAERTDERRVASGIYTEKRKECGWTRMYSMLASSLSR
jgi:hypothetical protein